MHQRTVLAPLVLAILALHHLPRSSGAATVFGPGVHDGKGVQVLRGVLLIQNGATLQHYLWNGASTDLSGRANITITGCDIGNLPGNAILVHGGKAFTITANTFHDIGGTGIYTNGNSSLSNCHFDDNRFDRVYEPIHLEWATIGNSNCTVSRNICQHMTRHAIELQGTPSGLVVDRNWIDNWLPHPDPKNLNDSHMGISCATGATGSVYASGVRVTNNYVGANGIPAGWQTPNGGWWDFCAIEIMGDGSVVDGNLIGPWGIGAMDGWNGPSGWQFTNNILVGVHTPQSAEDHGANPAAERNNQSFASFDAPGCPRPGQPGAPASPATQPALPATQPSATPDALPATGPAIKASGQSDGIHVDGLPDTGGAIVASATHGSQTFTTVWPAGATSAVLTNVPNQWEVDLAITNVAGVIHVQAAANQQFAATKPASVPPPATAPPTKVHEIDIYSDGSIRQTR